MIRRRSVLVSGSTVLLFAVVGMVYLPGRFETRYEGKTVDDWIANVERQVTAGAAKNKIPIFMIDVPPPNQKVIAAFGESAIPALRKAAASRKAWLIVRTRRLMPIRELADMMKSSEERAMRRCEIAQRWLQELLGPPPPQPIILPPTNRTNDALSNDPAFV